MKNVVNFPNIRNITVSGRIASGASTLAKNLSRVLGWDLTQGGDIFRKLTNDHGYAGKRADDKDLSYEENIKNLLKTKEAQIVESHLAGFDSQGIKGVFKILVICEDESGIDRTELRIDRLVNRDHTTVEDAKKEVMEREEQNLAKWRRLYANGDENWVYWEKKYYDFVLNTYSHNPDDSLGIVLSGIGFK